jgi:AraC-like ligand binding domain
VTAAPVPAYGPRVGKYMADADMPMDNEHGPLHFTDGTLAYAGLHLHVEGHPMHTHRFVEVAFAVGGSGTHDCLAGRHHMTPGDVVLLRPLDRYRSDVLGLLSLLLGELGRAATPAIAAADVAQGRPHPAVRRAMRLLESDLARPWTLSDLAEELHLAPADLVRLFKDATGLPRKAYLAQVRAERAAVLLLHSDDPVTAIGRGRRPA